MTDEGLLCAQSTLRRVPWPLAASFRTVRALVRRRLPRGGDSFDVLDDVRP
jgi:hypothetical protein